MSMFIRNIGLQFSKLEMSLFGFGTEVMQASYDECPCLFHFLKETVYRIGLEFCWKAFNYEHNFFDRYRIIQIFYFFLSEFWQCPSRNWSISFKFLHLWTYSCLEYSHIIILICLGSVAIPDIIHLYLLFFLFHLVRGSSILEPAFGCNDFLYCLPLSYFTQFCFYLCYFLLLASSLICSSFSIF